MLVEKSGGGGAVYLQQELKGIYTYFSDFIIHKSLRLYLLTFN